MKSNRLPHIEISQSFITMDGQFLMQLRDFKPSIVFPGCWGFFAGHMETGESAEETILRELQEELCWQPSSLIYLGSLEVEGNRRIHVHQCQLDGDLESLSLQEGQEIGTFTLEEIIKGSLFSNKWKQFYSITPTSEKIFRHFILKGIHV